MKSNNIPVVVRSLILVWISFTLTLLCFCSSKNSLANSEAGNTEVISSSALITLPTSLADKPMRTPQLSSLDEADIQYSLIRFQNHFINTLVNAKIGSVRWILDSLLYPQPWKMVMEQGTYETIKNGYHFTFQYNSSKDTLPFHVTIRSLIPGKRVLINVAVNGSLTNPKGRIVYCFDKPIISTTDSLTIMVQFVKTANQRTMTVEVTQKLLLQSKDQAQSLKYSVSQEGGFLSMSSGIYFPYINNLLKDTSGYCFVSQSVTDTSLDRSIVRLGVAPSTYADTLALFTQYGVASMMAQSFINFTIPTLKDTVKMIMATSYKQALTIEQVLSKMLDPSFVLNSTAEALATTPNDLKLFLSINKDISNPVVKANFRHLLWLLKMDQPVYFGSQGYVGNGNTVPVGFESIASMNCTQKLITPLSVKNLKLP